MVTAGIVVTDLESDSEVDSDVEPAGELVVPEVVAEHQAPLLVSETRPSTALILFKPLSTPPTHTSESEQRRALLRTRRKSRA
jgi:hypothetical protein